MVIIIKYREEQDEKGRIHIHSEEESVCPVCTERLTVIGIRNRCLTDSAGDRAILAIRRLRCTKCRKIHHELPDKVVPYKRHCAETVENIVSGETADVCCDLATKRRIRTRWAEFSLYFTSMLASLRMKYGAVFSASPVPRETVRAAANAHLWVHTRSAVTPA